MFSLVAVKQLRNRVLKALRYGGALTLWQGSQYAAQLAEQRAWRHARVTILNSGRAQ